MSSFIYLSKSDLKIAQTCATKLYYKKLGYPTLNGDDRYAKVLQDGGFIVAKMAQLLYSDGVEIKCGDDLELAIATTKKYLQQENVILFEPVIYSNHKLVRIDILVKQGNLFQVIEVKNKSFDSQENNDLIKFKNLNIFRNKKDGKVSSVWKPYIEDIAYQVYVLEEFLQELSPNSPDWAIAPYLLVPDKAKTTNIDRLFSYFKVKEITKQEALSKFRDIEIEFTGDPEALKASHILTHINVEVEVSEVISAVRDKAKIYLNSLIDGIKKIPVPISKNCKGCEFRGNKLDGRDGFKECWAELAEVEPHILDLYQGGRIGGNENPTVNLLIQQGKVSLYDMPLEELTDTAYSLRQLIQIDYTKNNREWISKELPQVLNSFAYPLHFIDFETSRMSIPYYAGMRPSESVAFQWSCHTIQKLGDAPIHTEWIDIDEAFPNFRFAETLMQCLGESGTVFTWASHENSVLRDIYFQMETYGYENAELKSWLSKIIKFTPKGKTRLADLHALTLRHYFHPMMKGKTSLKTALPAIWINHPYLHQVDWLSNYFKEENGKVLSPYEVLANAEISEQTQVIKEGLEAMLAYQEIVYGKYRDDAEIKQQWLTLLKQYCCLDTMAMVIVWTHWQHLVTRKNSLR